LSPSSRRAVVIVAPSSCCRAVRVAPSRPPSCIALSRRRHNRAFTPSCRRAIRHGCTFPSHTEAPSCRRAVVAMSSRYHRRAGIPSRPYVVVPSRRRNFAVTQRLTLSLRQSRSVALSCCCTVRDLPSDSHRHCPSRAVRVASGPSSPSLSRAVVALARRRGHHPASRRRMIPVSWYHDAVDA
jgi:hypothetical protein